MTNIYNNTQTTYAIHSIIDEQLVAAEYLQTRLYTLISDLNNVTCYQVGVSILSEYFYLLNLYRELVDEADGTNSLSTSNDTNW